MRRFLALFVFLFAFPAFAATPTIDGSGTTKALFNAASSGTVNVTTTSTNDIILLAVQLTLRSGAAPTISSVTDAASLTWHLRKQVAATYTTGCFSSNTCHGDFELWWAFSSATLTANTITVHLSGTTDEAALMTLGVNGVHNTAAPFDTNAAFTVTATNPSGTFVNSTLNVTTSEAHDLIFTFWGSGNNGAASAATGTCSGWTVDFEENASGALDYAGVATALKGFSTTQSALAVGIWGNGCSSFALNAPAWTLFGDALTGDAQSSPVWVHAAPF